MRCSQHVLACSRASVAKHGLTRVSRGCGTWKLLRILIGELDPVTERVPPRTGRGGEVKPQGHIL